MQGELSARNCFGDANPAPDLRRLVNCILRADYQQAHDLTPLTASAFLGHSAVIRLLIEHGAAVGWQVRVPWDRLVWRGSVDRALVPCLTSECTELQWQSCLVDSGGEGTRGVCS